MKQFPHIYIVNFKILFYKTCVIPVDNSKGSLIICCINFSTVNFLALSRIPFQSYMLTNGTSRQTLNAISHK
jgi:hypothetical protein